MSIVDDFLATVKMVECEPKRAKLMLTSCIASFRRAQEPDSKGLDICRACPIGAGRAGVTLAPPPASSNPSRAIDDDRVQRRYKRVMAHMKMVGYARPIAVFGALDDGSIQGLTEAIVRRDLAELHHMGKLHRDSYGEYRHPSRLEPRQRPKPVERHLTIEEIQERSEAGRQWILAQTEPFRPTELIDALIDMGYYVGHGRQPKDHACDRLDRMHATGEVIRLDRGRWASMACEEGRMAKAEQAGACDLEIDHTRGRAVGKMADHWFDLHSWQGLLL